MSETTTINYRAASEWQAECYRAGRVDYPGAVETEHGLMLPVTPDNLSDLMDFDHVIQVHEDGTVSEPEGIYAPDLYDGALESAEWSLFGNYSGQQGGGALMHNSEYIGGRMASDILDTPGVYVSLVCYWTPEDDDDDDADADIEGWAIARLDTVD